MARFVCTSEPGTGTRPSARRAGRVAAGPQAASVKVGDEITVCADGPGQDVRGTPHVAFGKGVYLAVWREGWNGEGGTARIFAARLDPQGQAPGSRAHGGRALPETASRNCRAWPLAAACSWWSGRTSATAGMTTCWAHASRRRARCSTRSPSRSPPGRARSPCPTWPRTARISWWRGRAVQGEENVYRVGAARIGADGRPRHGRRDQEPVDQGRSLSPNRLGRHQLPRGVRVAESPERAAGAGRQSVGQGAGRHVAEQPGHGHPVRALGGRGAGPGDAGRVHALAARLLGLGRTRGDDLLAGRHGREAGRRPFRGRIIRRASWPTGWISARTRAKAAPGPTAPARWRGTASSSSPSGSGTTSQKTVSLTNCDLIASRVDGWKPLDGAGVPVAATELEEKNPALASDGAGKLLCVYEKHDQDGKVAIVAACCTLELLEKTTERNPARHPQRGAHRYRTPEVDRRRSTACAGNRTSRPAGRGVVGRYQAWRRRGRPCAAISSTILRAVRGRSPSTAIQIRDLRQFVLGGGGPFRAGHQPPQSLLLQTPLYPEHHRVNVQGPRFPPDSASPPASVSRRNRCQFLLIQAELAHALFRGQIRVPAVQSPAEELIERLNWALRNIGRHRTAVLQSLLQL